MPSLVKLLKKDDGQDMVEYALLAAFLSIVAIATLRLIGPLIVTMYDRIRTAIS